MLNPLMFRMYLFSQVNKLYCCIIGIFPQEMKWDEIRLLHFNSILKEVITGISSRIVRVLSSAEFRSISLPCFDAVDWATGRASGL